MSNGFKDFLVSMLQIPVFVLSLGVSISIVLLFIRFGIWLFTEAE